jgi:2-amino-4-hydroxy-6-hydroxymethyldihydropteridine diphosphokinase
MHSAYIGLGSNLKEPIRQIETAISELSSASQIHLLRFSRFYRNPPLGLLDQPPFINAVCEVSTTLSPIELLGQLQVLEQRHQRVRVQKNGPRTLDLDLLLYGKLELISTELEIPHPRMKERAFVLLPLADLAPELILPCGSEIKTLLNNCNLSQFECVS